MAETQYNTTWVKDENSLPPEGVKCIKCEEDTLRKGKAEWGGGLYCPSCKWKWKVSKYPESSGVRKEKSAIKEADQGEKILQAIANLRTFEREIAGIVRGDIKKAKEEIIERIDTGGIIYPDKKDL